jgi:DNA-binding transcriptional MerR regulator
MWAVVTPSPSPSGDVEPRSAPRADDATAPVGSSDAHGSGESKELGSVTSSGTEATMRISDAAERAGVSPRTLRFYEELGLIAPSGHTTGGARRYAPEDLARIERIQELKDVLGLGLDEVKEVLETEARLEELRNAWRLNARASTATARRNQRAILVEALARREAIMVQLDLKMERLAAFRAKLMADASKSQELLDTLDD